MKVGKHRGKEKDERKEKDRRGRGPIIVVNGCRR